MAFGGFCVCSTPSLSSCMMWQTAFKCICIHCHDANSCDEGVHRIYIQTSLGGWLCGSDLAERRCLFEVWNKYLTTRVCSTQYVWGASDGECEHIYPMKKRGRIVRVLVRIWWFNEFDRCWGDWWTQLTFNSSIKCVGWVVWLRPDLLTNIVFSESSTLNKIRIIFFLKFFFKH